jgi:hypothetical protein
MGAGAAKSWPSRQYALPYGWNLNRYGCKSSRIYHSLGVFFTSWVWILQFLWFCLRQSAMSLRNSIHNLKIWIKIGNVLAKFDRKNFNLLLILTTMQFTKRSCYQLAYSNYSFSPSSSCAQPTGFGRASLPVATSNLWYSLDFSSRYALIPTFLPLSRPSAVLRYRFLTFFTWFPMDFSSRYALDHYHCPLSRPSAVLRYLFLLFFFDLL